MQALVLDGSLDAGGTGERVRRALETRLAEAGWTSEIITLRERRIGACAGDFYCWTRSPGLCNTDDDNRAIAASTVRSDLLVLLTPVTFGGYSSELKKAIDHQIQILRPGFAQIDGETHHRRRYARYADILALGWLDTPDPDAEAGFATLAARYAVNFHAVSSAAQVVDAGMTDDAIARRVSDGFDAITHRRHLPSSAPALPVGTVATGSVPSRAVMLVGSPRTRSSTSASLAAFLAGRLEERGVDVDIIQLHPVAGSTARLDRALDVVEAADLVVLAAPLYVDSLPAPVIRVLERLAARRSMTGARTGTADRPTLAALVNCGFPEAEHNAPALALCERFAKEAGYAWAGGLAVGGGQGLVHAQPLETIGPAGSLRAALELAADALARGATIPPSAQQRIARPFVPAPLYRAIGGLGWWKQARRWGAVGAMRNRPYDADPVAAGRQASPTR